MACMPFWSFRSHSAAVIGTTHRKLTGSPPIDRRVPSLLSGRTIDGMNSRQSRSGVSSKSRLGAPNFICELCLTRDYSITLRERMFPANARWCKLYVLAIRRLDSKTRHGLIWASGLVGSMGLHRLCLITASIKVPIRIERPDRDIDAWSIH